jgi:hypothetical protein
MNFSMETIARWKIYIDRSRQYVSYVQFGATLYIVAKLLRPTPLKTWIFDHWYVSFPVLFVIFMGGCLVLGYIENRMRIRDYEQKNHAEANPAWKELIEKIDKILENKSQNP